MPKKWVVAWVTPLQNPPVAIDHDDACWLMVRHEKRGWELPGGWVEDGEDSIRGALREVYEETGLLGTARKVAENLADGGGDVVWIEVDIEPVPEPWDSQDLNIKEVGWCLNPPQPLAWSEDELRLFSCHDWMA
ncbi:MAG: NUDIX domain-containing protein [Candidatus Thalassarchaeaceae archaeon]|nr:NUDIX domain-containing protein [Candidatus Thalassarchaeaceae archaeon]